MNGTWLAFLTLLIVALIAVAMGAQQIQAQQALEIGQLTEQRNTAVKVALVANEQRDNALKARDEALATVSGLNGEIASLRSDLVSTQSTADNRQQEIDRLVKEANDHQARVQLLQARNTELEAQSASLPQGPMPVTGGPDVAPVNTRSGASTICLPLRAGDLPNQLGIGLVALIGMAALGSGGYLYHRHDHNRQYSVKMTRDQIKEYARYQRERGSRGV